MTSRNRILVTDCDENEIRLMTQNRSNGDVYVKLSFCGHLLVIETRCMNRGQKKNAETNTKCIRIPDLAR